MSIALIRFLLGCVIILPLCSAGAQEKAPPRQNLITSALSARQVSTNRLGQQPQVRIDGVITYYDRHKYLLFVQDDTGGIFIRVGNQDLGLRDGDLVKVEGVLAKGHISNVIEEPSVTRLGRSRLPAPVELSPERIVDPVTDCVRVRVKGVLRSISEDAGRLVLYVGVGKERIPVTVLTLSKGEAFKRIGKNITVTGVHAGLFNEKRERHGMQLFCPSARDLSFEEGEGGGRAQDIPTIAVAAVKRQAMGTLVRVEVLADQFKSGSFVQAHDGSGAIWARTMQVSTVNPGTVLDLVGYVVGTNSPAALEDAYFRRIGIENITSISPEEKTLDDRLLDAVADIRRLRPEEAAKGYPVRVRGVITYYDPLWEMCFVQGATEGIYVKTHGQHLDIETGDLVYLSGITAPGEFAPVISKPRFEVTGKAPMPSSKKLPFSEVITGSQDSQWLELEGIIQTFKDTGSVYELGVEPLDSPETAVRVVIPRAGGTVPPSELVGSRAQIEAVCISNFDTARRLKGVGFLCPDFRHVRVAEGGTSDPFVLPLMEIASTFHFRANEVNERRVHVVGTVAWTDQRGSFFVQDSTGGLKVQTEGTGARAAVGDKVDVVGFRSMREAIPTLSHAMIKTAGVGQTLVPVRVSAAKAIAEAADFEGRLLVTAGHLLETRRTPDGAELVFRDGTVVFSGMVQGETSGKIERLESGSTVEIVGVGVFGKDAEMRARSLQVLARGINDLKILRLPPLLNARRMVMSIGLLVLFCVLAALWILVLRNRIAHHQAKLEANMQRQKSLEAQVLQAQKMESIGNLAGGIAHDFNNLLMVILGYADTLGVERLSSEGQEAVTEISAAGQRAAELTKQLLLFSRKQTPEPKTLNINETVRGMTRMLQRLIGEDVALQFSPGSGDMITNADKGMFEQVIMNLAVNARDAMPKGGSLLISTSLVPVGSDSCGKPAEVPAGKYIRLSVTDTGQGISEKDFSKIFDPFFTTKEIGKGTGLGLATVYGIVNQHQGWIQVKSKAGHGATFEIYLPLAETKIEEAAAGAPDGVGRRRATILLVEDEEHVRKLARQTLQRAGYAVVEANSGPAALAVARRTPGIDLVVSDVIMPQGMTGAELAEKVRADHPKMPIILMSGYSEFRGATLDLPGGTRFLQKPYSSEIFLRTVASALAGQEDQHA